MTEKRQPQPICIQVEDDVLWDLHALSSFLSCEPGSINDMMYRRGRRENSLLPKPLSRDTVRWVINGSGRASSDALAIIELVERFNLRMWSAKQAMGYKAACVQ